jgi:5-methylcytosine-specific restriction endonuclease McrA
VTSPAAVFRGTTRKEEKAAKRAIRRDAIARIRDAVFARARGKCERCGKAPPDHLHHLIGGIGRRRAMEDVDTCAALCEPCHRHVHAHPGAWR